MYQPKFDFNRFRKLYDHYYWMVAEEKVALIVA